MNMAEDKTRNTSDAPSSPYLAGRREWNERYGSYISREKTWRRFAFAAMAVAGISVIGNVYQASMSSVIPYAVELNGNSEVVRVTRADVLQSPSAPQVRAALRQWVIGARTVYGDPQALRDVIEQTYAMTANGSSATAALSAYKIENNPFDLAAQKTVTIDINAIVPVSEQSWQVEWTERTTLNDGSSEARQWQATITVKIAPPRSQAALMINPLGIYVTDFAWTERL